MKYLILKVGVMKNTIHFLKDEEIFEMGGGLRTVELGRQTGGGTGVVRELLAVFLGPLGNVIFNDWFGRVNRGRPVLDIRK